MIRFTKSLEAVYMATIVIATWTKLVFPLIRKFRRKRLRRKQEKEEVE